MTRRFGIVLVFALLMTACGICPAPAMAQTVLGPEFTLTKFVAPSLERDERKCEYFFWSKLGTNAQRVVFSYTDSNGKSGSDTPRIENVTIVIKPAKNIPAARMAGTDDNGRTLWNLEMSQETYAANEQCLSGVPKKTTQ